MATQSSGPKVTIACKLQHGLVLQLSRAFEVSVPVLGGGTRVEKQHRHIGDTVTIAGVAYPQNVGPQVMIVGGYALTPDVDAQFWAEWAKQNAQHAAVKNHLIFAYEKEADVKADAKEHAELRSGHERLDPAKLPKGLKPAKEAASEEA